MLKSELVKENLNLKKELSDVCAHHERLTKILNSKIDENHYLKRELNEKEKTLAERTRNIQTIN